MRRKLLSAFFSFLLSGCWLAPCIASGAPPSSQPALKEPLLPQPLRGEEREKTWTEAELEELQRRQTILGKTPEGRPFYGRLAFLAPEKLDRPLPPGFRASSSEEEGLRKVELRWTRRHRTSEDEEEIKRSGIVDRHGYIIIPFRYLQIGPRYTIAGFGKGLRLSAVVQCLNRNWGAIDASGRSVIPCIYQTTQGYPHKDALRFVRNDGKVGLLSLFDGKIRLPFAFEAIGRVTTSGVFLDSCEAVKRDGLWGFVDPQGRYVAPPAFEDFGYLFYTYCPVSGYLLTDHFSKDTLAVKKNGKWGVIDRKGRVLFPFKYDALYSPRKDGRLYYQRGAETGFLSLPQGLPTVCEGSSPVR